MAHYVEIADPSKLKSDEMAYLEAVWGDDCSDIKQTRTKLLPENYEAKEIIDLLRLAIPPDPFTNAYRFPVLDAYTLAVRRGVSDPDDVIEKAIHVFCALSNQNAENAKKAQKNDTKERGVMVQ